MARGSNSRDGRAAQSEKRVTKAVPIKEYAVTQFDSEGRKQVFGDKEPFYAKYRLEEFTPDQRVALVNKTKEEYQKANQNLDQGTDFIRAEGLLPNLQKRFDADRRELMGAFGSKLPYPDVGVYGKQMRDAVKSLYDARSTGHIAAPEDLQAKLGYGDPSPLVRFTVSEYDKKAGGVYIEQSVHYHDDDGGGEHDQAFHFIPIRSNMADKAQDFVNAKAIAAYLDYFVPRTLIGGNRGAYEK